MSEKHDKFFKALFKLGRKEKSQNEKTRKSQGLPTFNQRLNNIAKDRAIENKKKDEDFIKKNRK